MKISELNLDLKKYNLKLIGISSIISACLIAIVHNLNLNFYYKLLIYPIIVMITYIINLKLNHLAKNTKAYFLLIPIAIIFLSSFFPIAYSNKILNIFIIITLISIFILCLSNKKYRFSRKIYIAFFKLFNFNNLLNLNYLDFFLKDKEMNYKKIFSIILGFIVSLPLVFILISLLSSFDSYFDFFVKDILDFLRNISSINFLRGFLLTMLIAFLIIFSCYLNVIRRIDRGDRIKIYSLSSSFITPILVMVNIVFGLFIISEISKLTTNFLRIPLSYTYATYAREGFFEGLIVTSINALITLFCLYYTRLVYDRRHVRHLILLIIAFSLILIFNSYYRMYLYINAYGFTVLRCQVILFLLMELIIFILIIKKILRNIKFNNTLLFASIILSFYLLNIFLCNDYVVNLINSFF